jgi:cation transport ATPase
MEAITLSTDLHCNSCLSKVNPFLAEDPTIQHYDINLEHPGKLVTIQGNSLNAELLITKFNQAGFHAQLYKEIEPLQIPEIELPKTAFWNNPKSWRRASFNTLNCLIGCSIGDFGMIIFLQAYYPETSMYLQMILAIIAGLMTSVALESTILRIRERFNWSLALKTAFSMSFISMIGMEIAMNATDFMITGGKASFNTPGYWFALVPALIAGFLLPLPYNYYKLQKHGKSCH